MCNWAATGDPGDLCGPGCQGGRGGLCGPDGPGDPGGTGAYMQKTCDVAEKAIWAKINLRKKCVNRDKM